MSENSFKVPQKKASPEKKESSGKTSAKKSPSQKSKAASPKKPAQKSKTTAQSKSTETKAKPKIEDNKIKPSSGRLKKQALPDLPDMSNLSSKERHDLILKKTGEKKESVKQKSKPVIEDKARFEKIKKTLAAEKSKEAEKIPALGHRNKKKEINKLYVLGGIIALLVAILMIIALASFIKSQKTETEAPVVMSTAAVTPEELLLEIKSGMSATEVSLLLDGFVDSEEFLSYLKDNDLTGKIRIGTYRIPYGVSIEQIAKAITEDRSQDVFTVYAGYTLEDIDNALFNRGKIKAGEFMKAAEEICKASSLPFAEGWFLSGSYTFKDASTLAMDMHKALLSVIKENSEAVAQSSRSLSDIVIIASMVNRETQDVSQMSIIAGIILNRLEINMPLGIDATTRYELNDWKSEISQGVYDKITPYNTRRKTGLPPSGIGCPSKEAILAVLNPVQTDALYYLHDDDGKLYTSLTYESHLETYDKVH